ncbi:globin domain-containing protein [Cribrihabitans neustonicus]|uniref:globin domain-containing protein n=1 Tax=Cribrihabitans neustonicus TaxID=1429085 RepID=UPI003B5B6677
MPLSNHDLKLLRDSYARLHEEMDLHSLYFYEALFRRAPELKAMFREDLEAQGMKFMSTLGRILDEMDKPQMLSAKLAELGRMHAAIGVTRAQFAPMEEALVDTMRQVLGDDMTEELERAWRTGFREVSADMIRLGSIPES